MNSSEKEDYRVLAGISLHETSDPINDVICKVYVPKRTNEQPRSRFSSAEESGRTVLPL